MKSKNKVQKRLDARIKSFNERGTDKVASGMNKPGSQNRNK